MTDKNLSTDSYKGVRDFYPADMAIQRYIFDTWAKTAESFGFERYDASILEPSDLYKAKGAENEELVNEQTYTFIDRGEREVTLRPEMTPTVARMVAAKRRELAFPLRWYSIPNLFRYERPQRGRLREHWQLNCDIFGSNDIAADVEIIALAYQTLIDFGARPEQFQIRINNRKILPADLAYGANKHGVSLKDEQVLSLARLIDKIDKIDAIDFESQMKHILGNKELSDYILERLTSDMSSGIINETEEFKDLKFVYDGLNDVGIKNVKVDLSLMRGFDYYTGTIFEIFEVDENGNSTGRAMLGGGRYDNLTGMFGGEPISGIGFGMGDVTMRDFLETHNLLPSHLEKSGTKVVIIPMSAEQNIFAQGIAMKIRQAGFSVSTDIGTKKVGDKISKAAERGCEYIVVVGEDEIANNTYNLKQLKTGSVFSGTISELISQLK